jgi:hypothetical protein
MQNIVFAKMLKEVWSFLSWELVTVVLDVLHILVGRYETFAINIFNMAIVQIWQYPACLRVCSNLALSSRSPLQAFEPVYSCISLRFLFCNYTTDTRRTEGSERLHRCVNFVLCSGVLVVFVVRWM